MSNKKTIPTISSSEASKMSVSALAVRPNDASRFGQGGLSAKALQEWFDKLPNLVKDKFNEIAQMLASTDAAKYITLGGEDNALGETLFDFLALFGPRGDGITDKNISDLIETLYQEEGDEGASSRTLKDIVASICARLVALKSFAGKSVGGISIYFEDDGSIGYKATDRDGNSVSLGKLDPIGKGGIGDGAVSFEKLDAELGGRVSRAFAKVRYTASDGKLHFDSADGEELDSIDLPLESIIVSGTFDTSTKDLVFTLVGGGTLRIPFDEYIEAVASDVSRLNAKTDKSFKTAALAGDSTLVFETHDGSTSTVDLSTVALDGQTRDAIARLEKNDVDHERRISNLEEHISDDYFVTDDSVAYEKAVPARACSSAKLMSLGGMTYRDEETNTLRDSKVTEIKSHGKNLFNKDAEWYAYSIGDGDTIIEHASYRTWFIDVRGIDNVCVSLNNLDTAGDLMVTALRDTKLGSAIDMRYKTLYKGQSHSISLQGYNYVAVSMWYTWADEVAPYVQVEAGSVATEYKPYREPISYPIPAEIQAINEGKGIVVAYQGVFADTIDIKKKKYIKRINTVELTGNEAFFAGGYYIITTALNLPKGYDAYYVRISEPFQVQFSNANLNNLQFGNTDSIFNYFADLNAFKAYLAERYASGNPVTVIYVLAEPIETDISAELEGFDNIIEVGGGGSLEFVNEYKNPVPSAVKYLLKGESAV